MLEIENLVKDYYIDKQPFVALNGISLTFPEIQFVSVLGPSGCGKTTLLNCIGGLDSFNSGDIKIHGQSLKEMNEKQLDSYRNNYIGFVFQNYYLIPQLTVLENIKVALAVRDYSEKEVEQLSLEALKQVGLENLKNKKPNQLSGGQAQRVAIARSIVTNPSIILADEPTGALDSENSRAVVKILKEIAKKRLVIMVTHNEELAQECSDRIIRMNDGKVISDENIHEIQEGKIQDDKPLKKSQLSWMMTLKLAIRNMLSRSWKTILTGVANSFGIIGIAFFLAVNYGFSNYSNNLSSASATSLPIVVSAYNRKTSTESFSSKNTTISYPDADEIYPSVDVTSQYSYTYNNFSPKYLSYLNSLQKEGLIREYTYSYGNSYSFNLCTHYPDSLNGKTQGGYATVDTTMTSYNYYAYQANLPYNVFHVLYGDMDQYDVIAGSMPQNENELVLVVDEYNAVDFDILQDLGFYNESDAQSDVEDTTLETKVKPIKFSDVIGKTYRVFNNDEFYQEYDVWNVTDGNGYERQIHRYAEPEIDETFYTSNGRELKISGIIRAKETSPFSILGPALCYLPSLQEILVPENQNSKLAQNIVNNMVFVRPSDADEGLTTIQSFIMELQLVAKEYENSDSSVIPTSKLNEIFNRYFRYYSYLGKSHEYISVYAGFGAFLSDCKIHSANIVDDSLLGKDLSSSDVLNQQVKELEDELIGEEYAKFYSQMSSVVGYANAYSQITSLVIFPVDLSTRATILERLDSFNEIGSGSDHAADSTEQVYYVVADANSIVASVGKMISLVSLILLIFAAVSLIVSSSMTALMTSNNVLERKKEIGLLRSLGSRKVDVVKLFEIEAIFTGVIAGLIGSLATFLLSFPINALINTYYAWAEVGTICDFVWYHAFIVTGVSVFISVIASLIPSIKASKKNPVDALRSE